MWESDPFRPRAVLGPREVVFGEREGADAFAGDSEDGVANGGENWRGGRVALGRGGGFGPSGNGLHFPGGPGSCGPGGFVGGCSGRAAPRRWGSPGAERRPTPPVP